MKAFLKRKDIEISVRRYLIDALGAMAQGLFCSLLIGTIINTIGSQFHIGFLTHYTVGGLAVAMSGPAMAVAIGYALHCPPLVLFSLATVGFASNALGGAGGPLAVLFVAILSAEIGKAVSKETKIDILITPLVTIGVGIGLSAWWAPALGKAAMKVGDLIMWATELQPFWMGILVSVVVGVALTLPISSAAICAALGLTGLAGGALTALGAYGAASALATASTGTAIATLHGVAATNATLAWFGGGSLAAGAVSSGMGTCGLVGQIGVYTGWINDIAAGTKSAITAMDWIGLILISFVLPAVLAPLINHFCRKAGWVKDGDMKLN